MSKSNPKDKMRSFLAFMPGNAPQSQKNFNEVDNLKGALLKEQEINQACEDASGWKADDEPLPLYIARLRERAENAEAKCAEMRRALEACDVYLAGASQPANRALIKHALSADCGKGWIRATERDELREALQDLVDWQNGPPLLGDKWETGWGNAMRRAEEVLRKDSQ